MKTWKIAEILRTKFRKILENREILSYFDILALSKCILYFDILLVFRILILKFSRFRTQPRQVLELDGASVELLGTEAAMAQALKDHSDAIVVDF